MNDMQNVVATAAPARGSQRSEAEDMAAQSKKAQSMLHGAVVKVIDEKIAQLGEVKRLLDEKHNHNLDQIDEYVGMIHTTGVVVDAADGLIAELRGKL